MKEAKSQRGIFFSIDALIAIGIIFLIILIAFPIAQRSTQQTEIPSDILNTLSSLKMSEITVPPTIPPNLIDPDKTILEQIGEFYVTNQTLAMILADSVLSGLGQNLNENIGLWYEDVLIWSSNTSAFEDADRVDISRQIISGYAGIGNESVTGFSARAFLEKSNPTKHFFFGGYVGDGNITKRVEFEGTIISAELELAINNDFDLYINDIPAGTYDGSGSNEFIPVTHTLDSNNYSLFNSGVNNVTFKGEDLHIAGGFIKIAYESDVAYEQPTRYYFSGIDGLINIYDGFYIPGDLTSLNIFLHLNSSFRTFLNMGNTTVFNQTTNGEEAMINIDNTDLLTFFNNDYNQLSRKTIPLRLGLKNVTVIFQTKKVDVFSVTDLSGSMACSITGGLCHTSQNICENSCGGVWMGPFNDAQIANNLLIETILNTTGNNAGLAGYEDEVEVKNYHRLSFDNESLQNVVNNIWRVEGGTCICCGINRAIEGFLEPYAIIGTTHVESRVTEAADDAEESLTNGAVDRGSPDLELIEESSLQEVGMRFQRINIPQGATITSTYIEFETDETDSGLTDLTFSAHDVDDAPTFNASTFGITSRQKTFAKITWENVPPWNTVSEKHQTIDLSPVIQEIIDRPGWTVGNSIVIIVNGTGKRVAESYDGEKENSPLLVIDFDLGPSICQNGIVETGEQCDNGGLCTGDNSTICLTDPDCSVAGGTCKTISGDGCSASCIIEQGRSKQMIVMSDGIANVLCSEQGTGNARDDAIQAACDAKTQDIIVHAASLGEGADQATMEAIAECGEGLFVHSSIDQLVEIYKQIIDEILATFVEQTINTTAEQVNTKIFSDSYIEFDYNKAPVPSGLILTIENQFLNETAGNLSIPEDVEDILETSVTSYSGPRWTDIILLNETLIYNLSSYGSEFIDLGDPYSIDIPTSLKTPGESQIVTLTTGLSPTNNLPGSSFNKIIYTIIKEVSSFSHVVGSADGCIWNTEFDETAGNM